MTSAHNLRRAAVLWFVASGLSLAAAVLTYTGDHEIKWPLIVATIFLAVMGVSTLRRSKSVDV